MKQAKWVQVRCRDGRVNRVPVQKIVRLLEKKGVFIPDLYDHAHIKHVSKLLEWREVCDFNQAWTDPIPVNYADEWKDRDFEIIEDETSDDREPFITDKTAGVLEADKVTVACIANELGADKDISLEECALLIRKLVKKAKCLDGHATTENKPEVKDVETKREPSKPRKRTSKRVQ